MDKANPVGKNTAPGISIRNGPVEEMDLNGPSMNGFGPNGTKKRKARDSIGKTKNFHQDNDEDGDEKPLVRLALVQ